MPRFIQFQLEATARGEPISLGIRGRARCSIVIDNDTTIEKGQLIIIQHLNPHNKEEEQRFRITPFKEAYDPELGELPESHRDIKEGKSYEVVVANPKKVFSFTENYQSSFQPLFPHEPCLEDIKQGGIADCFLLSAIQSIINHPHGPAFIKGMMRENEDGTVTARVFHPQTGEPYYHTLKKEVLYERVALFDCNEPYPVNRHPALWVHMLESAYATMGFAVKENAVPSVSSVFNGGGFETTAVAVLTGLRQKEDILKEKKNLLPWEVLTQESIDNYSKGISGLDPNNDDDVKHHQDLMPLLLGKIVDKYKDFLASLSPYQDLNDDKLEEEACKKCIGYYSFYIANKEACDGIIRSNDREDEKLHKLIALASQDKEKNQQEVIQYFVEVYNYLYLPMDVKTKVVLGNVSSFNGHYNADHYSNFIKIQYALEQGNLVTAGTGRFQKEMAKEELVGLVPGHTYSVLKAFTKQQVVHDKSGREIRYNVHYVQLRNPWGKIGRDYKEHEQRVPSSIKSKKGIFAIELSEFLTHFDSSIISVDQRFLYEQKRLELTEFVNQISLMEAKTLEDLLDFQKKYEKFEKELLNLENLHLYEIPHVVKQEALNVLSSKALSEEEQKNMVQKLLISADIEPSIFFTGEPERYYVLLYRLLKLEALKQQQSPDQITVQTLTKGIINDAHHAFCFSMKEKKGEIDVIWYCYAKFIDLCISNIDKFTYTVNQLHLIGDSKENRSDLKKIAQLLLSQAFKIPIVHLVEQGLVTPEINQAFIENRGKLLDACCKLDFVWQPLEEIKQNNIPHQVKVRAGELLDGLDGLDDTAAYSLLPKGAEKRLCQTLDKLYCIANAKVAAPTAVTTQSDSNRYKMFLNNPAGSGKQENTNKKPPARSLLETNRQENTNKKPPTRSFFKRQNLKNEAPKITNIVPQGIKL